MAVRIPKYIQPMAWYSVRRECVRCGGNGRILTNAGAFIACGKCSGRGFIECAESVDEIEMLNEIPDLDPRSPMFGKQPRPEEIFCDDRHAYMSIETYDKLPKYEGCPYHAIGLMWVDVG